MHSGTACDTSFNQGGHQHTSADDPWGSIKYASTDADGRAHFHFLVESVGASLAGKTFIVHNEAGGRVACGVLGTASEYDSAYASASLSQIGSSGVAGSVSTYSGGASGIVSGVGFSTGLESDVDGATQCGATNGCGVARVLLRCRKGGAHTNCNFGFALLLVRLHVSAHRNMRTLLPTCPDARCSRALGDCVRHLGQPGRTPLHR